MSLSVLGSFNPISLRYFVPYSSTQSLPVSPAPNSSLLPLPTALRIQSPLRPILRRSPDCLFAFLFFRIAVDILVLSPLGYKKLVRSKKLLFLKIKLPDNSHRLYVSECLIKHYTPYVAVIPILKVRVIDTAVLYFPRPVGSFESIHHWHKF